MPAKQQQWGIKDFEDKEKPLSFHCSTSHYQPNPSDTAHHSGKIRADKAGANDDFSSSIENEKQQMGEKMPKEAS